MIPGLKIGHAADAALKSGVTVILPDEPAIAAIHVSGGAPAGRETDLLRTGNLVERVDAIVLSGGSAFGLAAADGVMSWLVRRGRGFQVGGFRVPIVPAASLFDLGNSGDKAAFPDGTAGQLYRDLGEAACDVASDRVEMGSVGAGTGATTADLKGGFGYAETRLAGGARLAALVAVNALGRVTLGSTPHFRAAPFEIDGEFGGLGLPAPMPADAGRPVTKRSPKPGESTTIAVIATDADISRAEAQRIAIAAHDGVALAIFPAHTPFDGDTIFVLATGRHSLPDRTADLLDLSAAAASTLARAIARGVFAAEAVAGDPVPTWKARYAGAT